MSTGTGTGGANTVTLTAAQMPSHTHTPKFSGGAINGQQAAAIDAGVFNSGNGYFYTTNKAPSGTRASYPLVNSSTGSGQAHSNTPLNKGVYAWRRTA